MENHTKEYQKVKISKRAYNVIKNMSNQDEYRGRGIIGVIDKAFLGEFSTSGSGNYDPTLRRGGRRKKIVDDSASVGK